MGGRSIILFILSMRDRGIRDLFLPGVFLLSGMEWWWLWWRLWVSLSGWPKTGISSSKKKKNWKMPVPKRNCRIWKASWTLISCSIPSIISIPWSLSILTGLSLPSMIWAGCCGMCCMKTIRNSYHSIMNWISWRVTSSWWVWGCREM